MPVLVCSDRDGTINEDDNFYLGSKPNWREQVRILDGVVEGIKLLRRIPNMHFFIVSNQSGVALDEDEFAELTEERMHEVNQFIVEELHRKGALVNGYFACPFVDEDYTRKATVKGRKVNPNYIRSDHPDLKPRIGMLEKAAQAIGATLSDPALRLYVIGDRLTDVQMGLNARGKGILIASPKTQELGDVKAVERLEVEYPDKVYIAKNYLAASEWIYNSLAAN